MEADDRGDIDGGHHVAVEHHDRVVDALRGVADGPAGAERRRLDDVAQAQAEAGAVTEGLLEAARLVVEAENHLVDLRHPLEQVDLVGEEGPVEDRHDRLGGVQRQRPQPGALAAGEENGFHVNRRSYTGRIGGRIAPGDPP